MAYRMYWSLSTESTVLDFIEHICLVMPDKRHFEDERGNVKTMARRIVKLVSSYSSAVLNMDGSTSKF